MIRVLGIFIIMLVSLPAQASEQIKWINDAETGQFLMRDGGGHWESALLLNTEAKIEVNGPVARVTIRQQFNNRDHSFAEGVYVFPLPENAAIHGMDMIIGQRRIQGEIHEKKEAKKIYQQAKKQGKRAGLVEQQRANVFTTSVANIAAGEKVEVEIRYTQVLERDANRFSLRLPLTITPRYQTTDPERFHAMDLVEDDNGNLHPGDAPSSIAETALNTARLSDDAQRVTLNARINAGLPMKKLLSRSHDIRTARGEGGYSVTLAEGSVPMDRDFLLSWELNPRADSAAAFFTETVAGEHYGLLMMMPPAPAESLRGVRKEQILVIDQSGSMGGSRMDQARQSLQHALRRLEPQDRFNVLAFNNRHQSLFPQPVQASRDNIDRAMRFVTGLDAGGGTEMLPALNAALAMDSEPEYLRQLIFVTDGAIANEHALLDTVHNKLGHARLFPVGIGDAPNTFLMRRLARFGRGSYTYINDNKQVQEKMSRLLDRIARPVLSDIRVQLPGGVSGEFSPAKIPDLYLGEPVVATLKMDRIPESIIVHGNTPTPWSKRIEVNGDRQDAGIASLWARDRIGMLMDRLVQGEAKQEIRPQVLDIALKHHLVSRYTSFVAVDRTPVRHEDEPLDEHRLTPRLPADMANSGRRFPSTALNTGPQLLLALILALAGLVLITLVRGKDHVHR